MDLIDQSTMDDVNYVDPGLLALVDGSLSEDQAVDEMSAMDIEDTVKAIEGLFDPYVKQPSPAPRLSLLSEDLPPHTGEPHTGEHHMGEPQTGEPLTGEFLNWESLTREPVLMDLVRDEVWVHPDQFAAAIDVDEEPKDGDVSKQSAPVPELVPFPEDLQSILVDLVRDETWIHPDQYQAVIDMLNEEPMDVDILPNEDATMSIEGEADENVQANRARVPYAMESHWT